MKLVPFAVYLLTVSANRYGVSAAESNEMFNDYEGSGSGWWNKTELAEVRESELVKPYLLKVTWWTLYLTVAVIGCIGNTAVVLAEFRNSICKAGLKCLLVQMCISDAIAPIIVRFPSFVQTISIEWPFGPVFCGISFISLAPIIFTNILSIAALAIERFLCFLRPGKLPMTRWFAWKIIGATWIFSILLSIPDILFHKTSDSFYLGRFTKLCHNDWPVGLKSVRLVYNLVLIAFITLFRLVPVVLLGYVYVRSALSQRCVRSSEQGDHLDPSYIHENRKIFSVTEVVVFGSAAFELPYLLFLFQTGLSDTTNIHINVWLLVYWLVSCRIMICPIIYFRSYKRNGDELQQKSRSERDSGCSNIQLRNGNESCSTSTI